MVRHERNQCNLPGALDGPSEGALMFGANPCAAARFNLSPL